MASAAWRTPRAGGQWPCLRRRLSVLLDVSFLAASVGRFAGFDAVARCLGDFELALAGEVDRLGQDAVGLVRGVEAPRILGTDDVQSPLRLAVQRLRRL